MAHSRLPTSTSAESKTDCTPAKTICGPFAITCCPTVRPSMISPTASRVTCGTGIAVVIAGTVGSGLLVSDDEIGLIGECTGGRRVGVDGEAGAATGMLPLQPANPSKVTIKK